MGYELIIFMHCHFKKGNFICVHRYRLIGCHEHTVHIWCVCAMCILCGNCQTGIPLAILKRKYNASTGVEILSNTYGQGQEQQRQQPL